MNHATALHHLSQEPYMARIISETHFVIPEPSGRVYYDLLEAVVSQQLSVKAATTIFNRFCALFPDEYPHPELLSDTPFDQLRAVGLSQQKASYLQNIAAFAVEHHIDGKDWAGMNDQEIIQLLTQIKGVGVWTVQMILIFTLGRPDVFPVDDLGIQQGMARLFGLEETGKALRSRMHELAAPWEPYRSIASRYLWKWKDGAAVIKQ